MFLCYDGISTEAKDKIELIEAGSIQNVLNRLPKLNTELLFNLASVTLMLSLVETALKSLKKTLFPL